MEKSTTLVPLDFTSCLIPVENVSENAAGIIVYNASGRPYEYDCLVKDGCIYRIHKL
jgi:hypothetical protein